MGQGSLDEIPKQGVGLHRLGLEFRMKLAAKKPGMIFYLDDFHQVVVR
jgi:hypothetical protein